MYQVPAARCPTARRETALVRAVHHLGRMLPKHPLRSHQRSRAISSSAASSVHDELPEGQEPSRSPAFASIFTRPAGQVILLVGGRNGDYCSALAALDVISRDDVSERVNAVVYFDQTLAERDKLNADVQRILDEQTDAWGIKVSNAELKHIDLDGKMVRAIARQAEAERLRRAKVIDAAGELQAAEKLVQTGDIMARSPESMQLRYLGTLANIAGEMSSTIVFPLPIDLLSLLRGKA